MRKFLWASVLFSLLAMTPLTQNAHAWIGVRVGIGLPIYVGPGPYYYGAPYYYAPPTYVAPPPTVIYQSASPTPSATPLPPPTKDGPSGAVSYSPSPAPTAPVADNLIAASNQFSPQVESLVRQLSDASDTARRDAAIELGRLKAANAVAVLANVLAKDASPLTREGAARALGLIAAPQSLNALIYAAQADNDREVRRSAQFAVEVIRSNLRGN